MDFRIGEKVVYPNQGVGVVEQICSRNLTGQSETFYHLRLGSTGLTVMVPMASAEHVGLRRVSKNKEVGAVLDYLNNGSPKAMQDWKGRFKQNSEKMRTGSLQQVAEVFKTLLVISQAKPLSFREKKMFDRSWQLLVDEISVARGASRDTVETQLAKAFSKSHLKLSLPS